jgi:hypothetical protein
MRLHELFTESKAQVNVHSAKSADYLGKERHGPDTPERIKKNLHQMAKSLKLELVPGFDDYTDVKPKKTDGAESPFTKTPGK